MAILTTGVTKVSGKVADTGGEVVLTAADVGAVARNNIAGPLKASLLDTSSEVYAYNAAKGEAGWPWANSSGAILSMGWARGAEKGGAELALNIAGRGLAYRAQAANDGLSDWRQIYHTGFKPTAADVGARPSNWLPSLAEIGAAASADLNPLIPAASASFTYTGSTLTQMTEQLTGGERVTSFTYTDGRLTSAVEVLGSVTKTTTFNYQNGTLTGFTTTEVVA